MKHLNAALERLAAPSTTDLYYGGTMPGANDQFDVGWMKSDLSIMRGYLDQVERDGGQLFYQNTQVLRELSARAMRLAQYMEKFLQRDRPVQAVRRSAGDVVPYERLRQKQQEVYCAECGLPVYEDASPGVWLHEDPNDDADHVAIPDKDYGSL